MDKFKLISKTISIQFPRMVLTAKVPGAPDTLGRLADGIEISVPENSQWQVSLDFQNIFSPNPEDDVASHGT